MIDDEDEHASTSDLGPPWVNGQICVADVTLEVAVWKPPDNAWEEGTWRGWLFIEGHPVYDPPRRVLGASRLQPIVLAFAALHQYMSEAGARCAPEPDDP